MHENPERVPVEVADSHEEIARRLAARIAEIVREPGRSRPAVLGLATGSTPVGIYRELIRLHRDEGLDFSGVVTFNLDEYYPMESGDIHSFHRFMRENFFAEINIDPRNVHIPRGDIARNEIERHCAEYETRIRECGGIDFQLLGIGQTGHIGFNEPGSSARSRTRLVALDAITRRSGAGDFFGEENVPAEAITLGVATIMEAREIALVATGEHKAAVVKKAVEGEIDRAVAATYLQNHRRATFYLDAAAAGELTRQKTPWLLGEIEWTPELEIAAVVWLGEMVGKSILKLDEIDYRENRLNALLTRNGSAWNLNGAVFNALAARIRGRSRLPSGKRVVLFSPHPDDDVISAGGILQKLVQNGNEIVVAYQTSGNIAVFDHDVRRYLDFLRRAADDFGFGGGKLSDVIGETEEFFARKKRGEPDSETVQALKRRIRESEAISAIETLGLSAAQARFLNLPFYRTGRVRKDPISESDVAIVLELFEEMRPEIVLVAGDFSDPHGTHRMCKAAVDQALCRYRGSAPEIWLYRGAWQEWPVSVADILIPMSEAELRQKIRAIFKHQSQKDRAPFPGLDEREFWQRVEERNTATARTVDRLGLPEYYAMEALVVERRAN